MLGRCAAFRPMTKRRLAGVIAAGLIAASVAAAGRTAGWRPAWPSGPPRTPPAMTRVKAQTASDLRTGAGVNAETAAL